MGARLVNSVSQHHVQVGDFVPRAGIYTNPGVVSQIKQNGDVVVDTDPEMIAKYHRYAITTGLTLQDKEKFNAIMDSVAQMQSNDERLNSLQRNIDELRETPNSKEVSQSLLNMQAVLIREAKELPRVFSVAADKFQGR